MALATMTTKGQITIPKRIRDELRLRPGMQVEFLIERDRHRALLVPKTVSLKALAGIFPKPKRSLSLKAMQRVIEQGWAGRR